MDKHIASMLNHGWEIMAEKLPLVASYSAESDRRRVITVIASAVFSCR
jgi:hypothetical protein